MSFMPLDIELPPPAELPDLLQGQVAQMRRGDELAQAEVKAHVAQEAIAVQIRNYRAANLGHLAAMIANLRQIASDGLFVDCSKLIESLNQRARSERDQWSNLDRSVKDNAKTMLRGRPDLERLAKAYRQHVVNLVNEYLNDLSAMIAEVRSLRPVLENNRENSLPVRATIAYSQAAESRGVNTKVSVLRSTDSGEHFLILQMPNAHEKYSSAKERRDFEEDIHNDVEKAAPELVGQVGFSYYN